MLTGQNGILNKAVEGKEKTEIATVKELAQIDIFGKQAEKAGEITKTDFIEILNKYFENVPTEENLPEDLTTLILETKKEYGKYEIKIGEIYNGGFGEGSGGTELPETAEGQPADTPIKNPESYGPNPNAQATADGAGKYFAKPIGATYVEGTVDTGVVIDIDGSEFVWVPVPEAVFDNSKASNLPTSSEAGIKQGNTYTPMAIETSTGNYSGILYNYSVDNAYLMYPSAEKYQGPSSDYREPDTVNDDGGASDTVPGKVTKEKLQIAYNEMVAKVAQYGGFYVGRYEMGIEGEKIVSKNANTTEGVTTADASQTETYTWYGLYQAGENFETTVAVKSSMIWGSQYDAMMNWMAKGGKTVDTKDDNKYNQEGVTGKSETDVINKIYDLYGCYYEWTLEAYSTNVRARRGGNCDYSRSPAFRGNDYPIGSDSFYSSRFTLYIQ